MIEVVLKIALLVFYTNMAYYWGKRKGEGNSYSAWKEGYKEGVRRTKLEEEFKKLND